MVHPAPPPAHSHAAPAPHAAPAHEADPPHAAAPTVHSAPAVNPAQEPFALLLLHPLTARPPHIFAIREPHPAPPIFPERHSLLHEEKKDDLENPYAQPADFERFGITQVTMTPADIASARVDMHCVEQGHIGDCWLISVLADLAYRAHRQLAGRVLLQRCYPRAMPPNHPQCWTMQLHDRCIGVDNHFPLLARTGKELKGAPQVAGNEWVMLLEKAVAKLRGSYAKLNSNEPQTALKELLGIDAHHYGLSDHAHNEDQHWPRLRDGLRGERYVLATTSHHFPHHEEYDEGIVDAHAYSVLAYSEGLAPVPRMVKLRNPWGPESLQNSPLAVWTGAWSPSDTASWERVAANSPMRTEILLDAQRSTDGEFWIPWTDMCQRYTGLVISTERV